VGPRATFLRALSTPSPAHARLRGLLPLLALFAAYLVTARLGLALGAVGGYATLVWPPTGIALFALVTGGRRLWPAVFAGALAANLSVGAPLAAALGIATGNTAEILLASSLLTSAGFSRELGRVRDVVALLGLAAPVSPLLGATVGVASLWAAGELPPEALACAWRAWWLGDVLGLVIVAPLLFAWAQPLARPKLKQLREVVVLVAGAGALAGIFLGDAAPVASDVPLGWPYFVFPGLFWAALRFTQKGATTAVFVVAAVTITATALGHGPFVRPSLSESLFLVQVFMAVTAGTALMLAAAVSERDSARAGAELRSRASSFLTQVSDTLAAAPGYEQTLAAVARLVVPALGDNCVVDLLEPDGSLRRVAEAAADPGREALLQRLRRFPPHPGRKSPALQALQTGKTVFIPKFDLAALKAISAGDEYTDVVLQLGPRSSVTVVMQAEGRAAGTITFGMAESGRTYSADDIALAEELAERAGAAIQRARDLEARREAEARLRATEQRFSAMFHGSPFSICLVEEATGAIVDANPAFSRLLGRSREELFGKTAAELGVHHAPQALDGVREALASRGAVHGFETRVASRSGESRAVSSSITRITLEGAPYLLVTLEDVTERRRAEQALRESELQFQTLADSIPQLAWSSSADGAITWFNRRWYEYTAAGPSDVDQGFGWVKRLAAAEAPGVLARFTAAIESGEPWEDVVALRRGDGQLRRHLSRARPVRDANGRIVKWFGTHTDVEDQKRFEEELSSALRARDDFLAVAGHELKTPLAALLLHVQSLRRARQGDTTPENLMARLEKVEGAALRLEKLIHQLLDVTRITGGRLQLEPARFEVGGLVDEVVERFSGEAERARCAITVSKPAAAWGTADRSRVDQIVSNLLSNAIKYGAGKPIDVELRADGTHTIVTVVDRGIGIEAAQQQRIFERFERAVSGPEFGGFGLGLWISRELAEASGGRIEVESAPGRGSKFSLLLPRGPGEEPHVVH